MAIDKYNLLKATFYSSASTRNVIIDERLEETFIKSSKEIERINFDDCYISLSIDNIIYKLLNLSVNFEITISVSVDFLESGLVKFCYDVGTSNSSLINEMNLTMLVYMSNNLIDNKLYEKIISKVKDGSVRFIVKTNRLLGFIPWFWYTDHFYLQLENRFTVFKKDAIFTTEDEARQYIEKNIRFIDYEDRIKNWLSFLNTTFLITLNK